jgi:hypothetical protein
MKRWMIEWEPEQFVREPMVFETREAAEAARDQMVAGMPAGDLPKPVVIEVVAGVLDALRTEQQQTLT